MRAARSARVDAVITDDPLMAGRALGLRPPRFFTAGAFIQGSRLIATGDLLTPRGVSASGAPRHGDDADHDLRPRDGPRAGA